MLVCFMHSTTLNAHMCVLMQCNATLRRAFTQLQCLTHLNFGFENDYDLLTDWTEPILSTKMIIFWPNSE